MARTLLEWTDRAGATGAMELDVVKARGFELTAAVTDFPVESGSDLTDHVRPQNGTVTLEGFISNTPLVVPATQMEGVTQVAESVTLTGGDGSARATLLRWSGPFDRRKVCDGLLAGLVATGTTVRLTTSLRTVESLAITRYKVDETVETGQGLPFILEFRALRIATTARAPVPAVRRLRVPASRGVQATDNRTALARLEDRVGDPLASLGRALGGG